MVAIYTKPNLRLRTNNPSLNGHARKLVAMFDAFGKGDRWSKTLPDGTTIDIRRAGKRYVCDVNTPAPEIPNEPKPRIIEIEENIPLPPKKELIQGICYCTAITDENGTMWEDPKLYFWDVSSQSFIGGIGIGTRYAVRIWYSGRYYTRYIYYFDDTIISGNMFLDLGRSQNTGPVIVESTAGSAITVASGAWFSGRTYPPYAVGLSGLSYSDTIGSMSDVSEDLMSSTINAAQWYNNTYTFHIMQGTLGLFKDQSIDHGSINDIVISPYDSDNESSVIPYLGYEIISADIKKPDYADFLGDLSLTGNTLNTVSYSMFPFYNKLNVSSTKDGRHIYIQSNVLWGSEAVDFRDKTIPGTHGWFGIDNSHTWGYDHKNIRTRELLDIVVLPGSISVDHLISKTSVGTSSTRHPENEKKDNDWNLKWDEILSGGSSPTVLLTASLKGSTPQLVDSTSTLFAGVDASGTLVQINRIINGGATQDFDMSLYWTDRHRMHSFNSTSIIDLKSETEIFGRVLKSSHKGTATVIGTSNGPHAVMSDGSIQIADPVPPAGIRNDDETYRYEFTTDIEQLLFADTQSETYIYQTIKSEIWYEVVADQRIKYNSSGYSDKYTYTYNEDLGVTEFELILVTPRGETVIDAFTAVGGMTSLGVHPVDPDTVNTVIPMQAMNDYYWSNPAADSYDVSGAPPGLFHEDKNYTADDITYYKNMFKAKAAFVWDKESIVDGSLFFQNKNTVYFEDVSTTYFAAYNLHIGKNGGICNALNPDSENHPYGTGYVGWFIRTEHIAAVSNVFPSDGASTAFNIYYSRKSDKAYAEADFDNLTEDYYVYDTKQYVDNVDVTSVFPSDRSDKASVYPYLNKQFLLGSF